MHTGTSGRPGCRGPSRLCATVLSPSASKVRPFVIDLLIYARIGDQRRRYFVTGYPSLLSTTRLPDDEDIRGRMHAERRQPSAAKHRFRGGCHRASLTRSTRRAPNSRGTPDICCVELRCRCLAANTDRSVMRVRADRGAAGCLRAGRQGSSASVAFPVLNDSWKRRTAVSASVMRSRANYRGPMIQPSASGG